MRRTLAVLAAVALSLTITVDAFGAGYATRTLKQGSSGSDVRALQRYLDQAGYNTSADGQFGPATRRSVMSFESAEQRTVNGAASRGEQRMVQARAQVPPAVRTSPRRRPPRVRTSAATGSPWPPHPRPKR
jgi:peptidoglycan hydrolase-like protein with peptidoglycan-binding domain